MSLFGHLFSPTRPNEKTPGVEKINKKLQEEITALKRAQIESQGLLAVVYCEGAKNSGM